MALPATSTWTATAQQRDAPLSRFWAVHTNASLVIWRLARHLEAITHQHGCWPGRGWDDSSVEHGTARALDWMISSRVGRDAATEGRVWVGDLIVAWLIRHADQLHIRHIIWNRRIWKRRYRYTATAWTNLVNRSGVSDWHEDHIHVYLDDAYGSVPDTPLGAGSISTAPGLPTTGVDNTQEEDMPLTKEDAELVATEVWSHLIVSGGSKSVGLALAQSRNFDEAQSVALGTIAASLRALSGKVGEPVDETAIISGVVASLTPLITETIEHRITGALQDVGEAEAAEIATAVVAELHERLGA